ncbi:MAG: sigma-54-dependent Fis family transcriptional regulator [Deltaproteobacteria bacterium]|nr:sigma-54-dependent Fis family transcriptional regulator [Deltaproteobacteria bacterium]
MAKVLIIDDDEELCKILSIKIGRSEHETRYALSLADGCRFASEDAYDVIYLDLSLQDGSGLDAIAQLKRLQSEPEIIIMTGTGDPDSAEIAIKSGVWDYIKKPFSLNEVILPLERALQYHSIKRLKQTVPPSFVTEGIIGNSHIMQTCLKSVAEAAISSANVLISGETGTGKELIAWAIHRNSSRSDNRFVIVDCASLTDTLVESALFGHEKGAYTGADKSSEGLVLQADGGTLFLDEIGELPLPVQKSFLRILQERRFRPLGGQKEIESDFRLVAATNRDLMQMVNDGLFRKDLLFRIQSFVIEVPPLRDHLEDINDLLNYYIDKICGRYKISVKKFSPEFLTTLRDYDWPGNVREFVNTIERVIASAYDEPVLYPHHLPTHIRIKIIRDYAGDQGERSEKMMTAAGNGFSAPLNSPAMSNAFHGRDIPKYRSWRENELMKLERAYIEHLMDVADHNMKEAIRLSGLGQTRLYEILRKHQITK